MDTEIRSAIIEVLSGTPLMMDYNVVQKVGEQYKMNPNKISQTIHLMKDAGEIAEVGQHGAIRLSLKTFETLAPKKVRFKRYMLDYLINHWLAILAFIISVIALFKN